MENGPLFSDEEFFQNQLNLDYPGMENTAQAIRKKDYLTARKEYAKYIRTHLKPEQYFTIPYDGPGNCIVLDGETEIEAADRICTNRLVSCGTPYSFGDKVDWYWNATPDGYPEWTWQLSRHNEWKLLAHAYQRTGDERYAKKCADFFASWVKQARYPGPMPKGWSLCWRTIECGIRMGCNWPYALHAFFKSPAFTDDILVDWAKSVCEHGYLLQQQHKEGNWLIMEMNGLAQLSIFFPELSKSPEWLDFAFKLLEEELKRQIYPDGFQYELSTNYHEVVLANYVQLVRVAMAYQIPVPDTFFSTLELAAEVYPKLMMPNGRLPDLNDGCNSPAADFLEGKLVLFPKREDFRWVVSHGKSGHPPVYNSVAMPYSGIMVMRSGWQPDDVWALLDSAPFGHGHQHEDKLSLLMFAHGKLLLTEGGNYAYDESEMRKYVLSTRSHNTIRVDSSDQNRQKNYHWSEQDINRPADFTWQIKDEFEFAQGCYSEGYAAPGTDDVVHKRSVYFIKEPMFQNMKPFFLVVDRMYSNQVHSYENLWHLDSEQINFSAGKVTVPGLELLYSQAIEKADAAYGQTEPEWQGWIATSFRQGDYRPIQAVRCLSRGKNLRIVTILDPFSQFESVSASDNVEQTEITIKLNDGSYITLDEQHLGYSSQNNIHHLNTD